MTSNSPIIPLNRIRGFIFLRGRRKLITALGCALVMMGCVSKPLTPEIICSQEHVSRRTNAAMQEFSKDIKPALRILRSAAADYEEGKPIGSFRQVRILSALKSAVKKFEKSTALQDIRLIAKTCDDPALIEKSVRNFLENEGTPPVFLALLEQVAQFRALTRVEE